MSYIRGNYYILQDINGDIHFSHNKQYNSLTENEIDIFIYLCKKRKELKKRIKHGKKLYNYESKNNFGFKSKE